MGVQSLAPTATASHTEHYYSNYYDHYVHRNYQHYLSETQQGRFQNIDNNPPYTHTQNYYAQGNAASSDSWSLKRLLGRHGKRRYRVLEREPNRLRKRAA